MAHGHGHGHDLVEGENKKIAVLISVLALFLAIAETLGKSAQTDALKYNVEASNLWAFFQAKTIRKTTMETAAEQMEVDIQLAKDPGVREILEKRANQWKTRAARYESEPDTQEGRKELAARARQLEAKSTLAMARYHNFEFGSAAFQIAIVLASSYLITHVIYLLWGALGLGGVGLLFSAMGLLPNLHLFGGALMPRGEVWSIDLEPAGNLGLAAGAGLDDHHLARGRAHSGERVDDDAVGDEQHPRIRLEAGQVGLQRLDLLVPVLEAADEVAERGKNLRLFADGELRGLLAPAPGARQHAIERQPALPEGLAGAPRMGASLVAQVALGGAVVEPVARRIAVAARARRVGMAHEDHVARLLQQRPRIALGERRRGGNARQREHRGKQQPRMAEQRQPQLRSSGRMGNGKNSMPSSLSALASSAVASPWMPRAGTSS